MSGKTPLFQSGIVGSIPSTRSNERRQARSLGIPLNRLFIGVNLILFDRDELERPLAPSDRRAIHIRDVLRRTNGEVFDAGIIDGPRGKGRVREIRAGDMILEFTWQAEPLPLEPVNLIMALPRPQTARDVLRDATTLGVRRIDFVLSERTDPNYAHSSLWREREWRRHLILGAEQAFCTRLPEISHGISLPATLQQSSSAGVRLALDNYEATSPLAGELQLAPPITIAIGPERGWSAGDRDLLRAHDFRFVHLGTRVLRAETACIAALTLVLGKIGAL